MFKWIFNLAVILFLSIGFAHAADKIANVKSVNFIQEGEISKLIIDFDSDVFAERTVIKDDKQIILDIKNVKADKKFLRGIDTSEFSGSSVFISPYKKPGSNNDLRFAIQLRDNVRSILEQKSKRLILHIENRFGVFSKTKLKKTDSLVAAIAGNEERISIPKSGSIEDILENLVQSGVKKYIGKKISINVNSVNYQEILKMIADTSGFNIIIDNEINTLKPLTLSLTNIPWDQALDTILSLGDLVGVKHANILTIKTEKSAREEKRLEFENSSRNKIQEPLVTKIFPVSFADAKELITILEAYTTKERGSIAHDTRTSNIIVKDTVEVIERIKKIVDTLDTQTPQVLIESKIIEATEDYEFKAGLGRKGLSFDYDPIKSGFDTSSDGSKFSLSTAPDAEFSSVLGASVTVFKRLSNLNFSLQLMESESKGRIVSSPKVITQHNQKASLSSTEARAISTSTITDGVTTEGFETVEASVSLEVTPRVTNEGSIAMEVDIQKSGFTTAAAQGAAPNTVSNAVKTNVLVNNGSTIVIGGLYQTKTAETQSGIPFLKDLPLIGWLFKTAYNPNKNRSELIVFITPRIINQEEAGLVDRDSTTTEI